MLCALRIFEAESKVFNFVQKGQYELTFVHPQSLIILLAYSSPSPQTDSQEQKLTLNFLFHFSSSTESRFFSALLCRC